MNTPCLLVATTGRALARSARRGAHPVFVLDLFADRDTRAYAAACRRLPACGLDFDAAATIAAAGEFCPPPAPLVTGSGFENNPGLIASLARGRPLFGNSPETVAAAKDPRRFFALLDRLDIPHPETTTIPPRHLDGWLVKTVGACGGIHVRPARPGDGNDPACYFQRQVGGTSASVLFLADGHRACVVGDNEQWVAGGPAAPFGYGGAINRLRMPVGMRARLAEDIDALVGALGLVGLNGIDLIVRGDDYVVLEINPRPTATIDLHDDHHVGSLFDLHVRACQGELPESLRRSKVVRAHAVVYAPHELRLDPGFRFPEWCSDLPASHDCHATGMPVCMVHASGSRVAAVKQLLHRRRTQLENMISEPTR